MNEAPRADHRELGVKVSVVVPVYNPGRYIEPLIESLLAQTLPASEFEAIFVDDGSTDDTPARLDAVAAAHPHLRVIHQPNSGWPGKPRNVGMDAARGEFIHFVDHDDYLAPDALARLYDRAIDTGADIVLGKVVSVQRKTPMDAFWQRRDHATLATDPLESTLTPHKLFRTAMLRDGDIRYPEGKVRLEDNLFVLKAYFAARSVAVLADSPCYYFVKRSDAGNHSFERFEPAGYYANLREVLDVVEQNTEPGELRDRLLRHFYLGKMLGRLREPKLLRFPADYREELFTEIRTLAQERFPDSVPDGLATVDRLRSVLLRQGRLPDLVTLARRCAQVRPWTDVRRVEWSGDELCLEFVVRLGFADGTPLVFAAERDGFRLDPRLTDGIAGADAVGFVSAERIADEAWLRLLVHNPKTKVSWEVPCAVSAELEPVDEAAGDGARTVSFVGKARLDLNTAACGGPLDRGTWSVRTTASLCGLRRNTPLGPVSRPVPPRRVLAPLGRLTHALLTDSDNVKLSIEPGDQMNRHDFLSAVHELLAPRSYVEIGVNNGLGLARARTRTIGVDPAFQIDRELACDLKLVRATSDAFYARADALSHFPEGVVDFTFIDGMHLFEFALRDFINAERTSTPASVIIFDDMLPRSSAEAARTRHTKTWAGDVCWMIPVLERYRPDLTVVPLDTTPTGLLLVAGLDPGNTVLSEHYDEILAEYVKDDPQQLPPEIEYRTTAADPAKVLASSVWADLVAARDGGGTPASVAELAALRGSASYVSNPPNPGVWPPKPQGKTKTKPKAKPAPSGPLVRQAKRAEHVIAVARDPKRRAAAARRLWKRIQHSTR
ncbi:MAG TPA: glycosyltransferase [Jatrophihabitantaceae bacterium]|nr:glycosyltransferase [Jatrophihabitantaceae bacterium]